MVSTFLTDLACWAELPLKNRPDTLLLHCVVVISGTDAQKRDKGLQAAQPQPFVWRVAVLDSRARP